MHTILHERFINGECILYYIQSCMITGMKNKWNSSSKYSDGLNETRKNQFSKNWVQ